MCVSNILLANVVSIEIGYIIGIVLALSSVIVFLFQIYHTFLKGERERLILSYENRLKEKNQEINNYKDQIKEIIDRENRMTDKVISVLENTNSIARDNLKKMQHG